MKATSATMRNRLTPTPRMTYEVLDLPRQRWWGNFTTTGKTGKKKKKKCSLPRCYLDSDTKKLVPRASRRIYVLEPIFGLICLFPTRVPFSIFTDEILCV